MKSKSIFLLGILSTCSNTFTTGNIPGSRPNGLVIFFSSLCHSQTNSWKNRVLPRGGTPRKVPHHEHSTFHVYWVIMSLFHVHMNMIWVSKLCWLQASAKGGHFDLLHWMYRGLLHTCCTSGWFVIVQSVSRVLQSKIGGFHEEKND